MSDLYEGIPLYHGTNNAIPSMGDASKGVPDYLYLTPNPQYNYIQSSKHVYQASVSLSAPYFTDNLSLIEGLRSNPERRELLRQLGYDSMVYNDRRDPLKGASGWGDDAAQVVLLTPSKTVLAWSDVSGQRNELKPPHIEPAPRSAIIGPVFHATTSHFVQFAHEASTDIGFHFGSRKAANQRLDKLNGAADVRVEENTASDIDMLATRLESGELSGEPHYPVLHLLLKKLSNPKPDLEKILASMSIDELADISQEYINKPDNANYQARIESAKYAGTYRVEVDGTVVANNLSKPIAKAMKESIKAGMMKNAYLTLHNPLEIDDLGVWPAEDMLKAAKPTPEQRDAFYALDDDEDRYAFARNALMDKGYDGLVYKNAVEDAGSTSYVAFSQSQIRIEPPRLPAIDAPDFTMNEPATRRKMKT